MRMVWVYILVLFFVRTEQARCQTPLLYLHSDKSVYTPNESVWFTGYLLNTLAGDTGYKVLYTVLADVVNKKLLTASRYVIDRGVAQGNLVLPDTVPAGDYVLLAYTNDYFKTGNESVFYKWISVRSNKQQKIIRPEKRDTMQLVADLAVPAVKVDLFGDSSDYHNRSKTCWKLRLKDKAGKPLRGVFSVSCSLTKRLGNGFVNIRQNLPRQTIQLAKPGFTIRDNISGKVLGSKGKPVAMLVMGKWMIEPFRTDSTGSFKLDPTKLIGDAGEELMISVAEKKHKERYKIELEDDHHLLNEQLAARSYPYYITVDDKILTKEEIWQDGKALSEVEIKGKISDHYLDGPVRIDSTCNAWVCVNDHLYCIVSPRGGSPTPGKVYYNPQTKRKVIFKKCGEEPVKTYIAKVAATQLPKEYPALDYGKGHILEPQMSTTLYWNYLIATDAEGKAEFTFYTNDLPGVFAVVVQGISEAGPFSETKEFRVGI